MNNIRLSFALLVGAGFLLIACSLSGSGLISVQVSKVALLSQQIGAQYEPVKQALLKELDSDVFSADEAERLVAVLTAMDELKAQISTLSRKYSGGSEKLILLTEVESTLTKAELLYLQVRGLVAPKLRELPPSLAVEILAFDSAVSDLRVQVDEMSVSLSGSLDITKFGNITSFAVTVLKLYAASHSLAV